MPNQPPPPPVTQWERIAPAALRAGLPPALLRSQIKAGLADIRIARLGRRGVVHVASNDLERFAASLSQQGAQR